MNASIEQHLRLATQLLMTASPTPRLDAEVLLMHVTGLARTALITCAQEQLPASQREQLQQLLSRREQGEPVAYLTGHREFWSIELGVTPDVLIPRPETELLVEQALSHIAADSELDVADLGTGSGAIAIAIATERPRCRLHAIDNSAAALAVARDNARRRGMANIQFLQGDWLEPLAGTRLDLIVSNPPYVSIDDPHLGEGDVRFEPRVALIAGADGLDAIRRIATAALSCLNRGGWLLLEHGRDQAQPVRALLTGHGYTLVRTIRDLAGHERVSLGRLRQ